MDTMQAQVFAGTTTRTYQEYAYDHAGRLLNTWQEILNGDWESVYLASLEYDPQGQLSKKFWQFKVLLNICIV